MTYFTPDRTRPDSVHDFTGDVYEHASDKIHTCSLADGRTAVVESAYIDGWFAMTYYYFDATGFEDATKEELMDFMTASGITWESDHPSLTFKYISTSKITDAQQRPIWEFNIAFEIND